MKVLIIGSVWPEIRSSAAGLRDYNLVSTFLNEGWQVSFASASKPNDYSLELERKGVPTFVLQINDSAFDSFIRIHRPDFVIFDRFMIEEQFGWRVQENC